MTPTALRISRPCQRSWEAMPGMGDGRYCASCDRVVLDLTVPADELVPRLVAVERRLAADPATRVCARARVDRQGRILGPTRRLLTSALAGLFAAVAAGCSDDAAESSEAAPPDTSASSSSGNARMAPSERFPMTRAGRSAELEALMGKPRIELDEPEHGSMTTGPMIMMGESTADPPPAQTQDLPVIPLQIPARLPAGSG